jgi:hypothetical protein
MQRFNAWIGTVLSENGQDLLRTKGILHFQGEPDDVEGIER